MKIKVLLTVHICLLLYLATNIRAVAQNKPTAQRDGAPTDGRFRLIDPPMNAKDAPPPPPPPWFVMPIKGAPYSAIALTEHTQTLGDGNQTIQKNEARYYRDSEGRTRIEQRLSTIGKWSAAGDAVRIMISDPVAGYHYQLDPGSRTARKDPLFNTEQLARERQKTLIEVQAAQLHRSRELLEKQRLENDARLAQLDARLAQIDGCRQQAAALEAQQAEKATLTESDRVKQKRLLENEQASLARLREIEMGKKRRLDAEAAKLKQMPEKERTGSQPEPVVKGFKSTEKPSDRRKNESLGNQVIEGVTAQGTRVTTTIPTGEIGNIRPIEVVDERWYSNELQIPVLTKHSDPRSGETIYRLQNINRSEPDHSLFEVPADYKIVDRFTQNIRKR